MTNSSAIRMYAWVCVAMAVAVFATPADAQYRPRPLNDPATGEKYHIEASAAAWYPTADMVVSSENFGISGTSIDFKKDLGLQDQKFANLRLVLRPSKRNKLRAEIIPISYDSSGTLSRDIIFRGILYKANLPVNSLFNWKAYRFAYEFDFVSTNRGFAGLVLEAKYTDVHVELNAPIVCSGNVCSPLKEFVNARAPIPALGGIGRYYIVPNISVTGELTGFKLPENIIKGDSAHYVDFDLYGTLNFTNYLGVQVGYRSLDVGIAVNSNLPSACPVVGTSGTNGCFTLKGPYLGVVARY